MGDLQIIGAPASNFVWASRIACVEKGVRYTLIPTMPHTPEVDAIHPFGKIPVMRHGAVTLCESRAICLYIDRAFAGPQLVPADPAGSARVEQWLSIVNTHVDPVLMRRYVGAYFFPNTPEEPRDARRGAPPEGVLRAAHGAAERTADDSRDAAGEIRESAGRGRMTEGAGDAFHPPHLYA
jgi:glutathione S-transferase